MPARAQPTTPDDAMDPRQGVRSRAVRRAGIAAIAALIAASLSGALGQKTSAVAATAGGYRMSMLYPSVARPGVDVRLEVRVTNPAGLGPKLTLSFARHYFDLMDVNSMRPDPDSSTSTGDTLRVTWDSPPGNAFQVTIDAMAEYGEHFGVDGETSVMQGEVPAVTVRYHTRMVP